MTVQQLTNTGTSLGLRRHCFSSAHWLSYFQGNTSADLALTFPDMIVLPAAVRAPLIRSLQRFQIGETGDGNHLKKYASAINDPIYEQCIDLFVKEEQGHARILAQVIQSMNGTLISWHWSDAIFVALRRMLGLKTEVFILLIAEIIGKCFYKACADRLENKTLKDTFSLIVTDEIFHLEFHASFMRAQMLQFSTVMPQTVYYLWRALFFAACLVFILDHWRALAALNVSPKNFLHDCSGTFRRTADRVLL